MNEQKLYAEQMQLWFKEQDMLGAQLDGTVKYYRDMAQINVEQLALHNKRIKLAIIEFNDWALKNGFPIRRGPADVEVIDTTTLGGNQCSFVDVWHVGRQPDE